MAHSIIHKSMKITVVVSISASADTEQRDVFRTFWTYQLSLTGVAYASCAATLDMENGYVAKPSAATGFKAEVYILLKKSFA